MFPLFEWYAWQCCQPVAVVFVIDCARFTNTRKCSGESPTILPIHDIDVPGVACRTSYLISFSQKNKFKWANLGNKARYIPSGAFTGADVQGLGGEDREGWAKDMLVWVLAWCDMISKIANSAPQPSSEPKPKAKKYLSALLLLRWCLARLSALSMGIAWSFQLFHRLFVSSRQQPSPPVPRRKKWKGEQGSKIILNRLKSYIEYMANLGGSPVVCTGGSSNCEKRFKCKVSYRKRKKQDESKRCIFNFTAKWDKHGYYIHLLSESRRYCNNGCAWHSCAEKNRHVNVN